MLYRTCKRKNLSKNISLALQYILLYICYPHNQLKPTAMAKSQDKEKKEVKKPAVKSLKEKRLEKKEKKAGKS